MKIRNRIRGFAVRLGILCAVTAVALSAVASAYPDGLRVTQGTRLSFADGRSAWVRADEQSVGAVSGDGYQGMLMLGVVPLKKIDVQVVEQQTVLASGVPFGIRMHLEGVLVVGLTDVDAAGGDVNPAAEAGLRAGDTVLTADGCEVTSNLQLAGIIEHSGGRPVTLEILRGGVRTSVAVTPVKSVSEGKYKSGIWIRDSTLGIGTLTFVAEDGTYGGLGHAVTDSRTGEVLSVRQGTLTAASVKGVVKSQTGCPGELKGSLLPSVLGDIRSNTRQGLYGRLNDGVQVDGEEVPVAMRQEIETGPAEVLCTLEGTQPQRYGVEIEKIFLNGSDEKNMVVRVTDERLLETAGGIVQGMSGSPIIQNGKLVGAVTHVFINSPTRGYGIFIENMLNAAA